MISTIIELIQKEKNQNQIIELKKNILEIKTENDTDEGTIYFIDFLENRIYLDPYSSTFNYDNEDLIRTNNLQFDEAVSEFYNRKIKESFLYEKIKNL